MLDTRVRFYARTPTALFQKMTPPTAQRPPSTLSVNMYARRCVYVGVYVGAHARKLRARATRIVYIGSFLLLDRSIRLAFPTIVIFSLLLPDTILLYQFLLSFLRSRIFQFTILPLFRSSNEHSVFFFFEETTIQIER